MCEAEEHTGVGAGNKASTDRCWWVEFEELACIKTWISLEGLQAKGCVKLKSIQGLEQATKPQLRDGGCSELKELPCMETWVSLEMLQAKGSVKLKSIQGLEQATKLQLIDVGGCSELEKLPCMEVLQEKRCVKLKSIQGLEQTTKLPLINVDGIAAMCGNMGIFGGVAGTGTCKAEGHTRVGEATKLRVIYVGGYFELEEMHANIGTFGGVAGKGMCKATFEELQAKGCANLKSIRGLEQATKLELIYVEHIARHLDRYIFHICIDHSTQH